MLFTHHLSVESSTKVHQKKPTSCSQSINQSLSAASTTNRVHTTPSAPQELPPTDPIIEIHLLHLLLLLTPPSTYKTTLPDHPPSTDVSLTHSLFWPWTVFLSIINGGRAHPYGKLICKARSNPSISVLATTTTTTTLVSRGVDSRRAFVLSMTRWWERGLERGSEGCDPT